MLKKLLLFFNTVKYLKLRQIFHRLTRKLFVPRITETFDSARVRFPDDWKHVPLHSRRILKDLDSNFLNHSKKLDFPFDWNNEEPSKLWTYNLHYFEDLVSNNIEKEHDFYLDLLTLWIDQNPVGFGNGWEPYPTSLRIVNILKAVLGGFPIEEKVLRSVHCQASYLSNNLEKHLLGNHYFSNLKALLFAGIIFDQPRWCRISYHGLLSEIPEQILPDGGNFELSPMYHSLMLVDMLDMLNLARSYPYRNLVELRNMIEAHIPKMLAFLQSMTHPDQGLSFFNDSVDGIAPPIDKIENYARVLGFTPLEGTSKSLELTDHIHSGYISALAGKNKLIFDAAEVGPDYIPGHAHADTLSFELSIGRQRVFVNSGVSEYGLSTKRLRQRGSISHNTLVVDGKDSSQIWGGFRVANRARVVSRRAELLPNKKIRLRASHDGYKKSFGGCLHTRTIEFCHNSLLISDELLGSYNSAKSRFHFHPSLNLSLKQGVFRIVTPKFVLQSSLPTEACSLKDSRWHPEFGLEVPNKVLEIDLECAKLEILFTWTFV